MHLWRTRAAGVSVVVLALLAVACSFGRPYTYDIVGTKPSTSLADYGQWDVESPVIAAAVSNMEQGDAWKSLVGQIAASIRLETEKSLNALRTSGKPLKVRMEITEMKRASWPVRPRLVITVNLVDPSSGSSVGSYTVGGWVKHLEAEDMPYYAGCIAEFVDDYSGR